MLRWLLVIGCCFFSCALQAQGNERYVDICAGDSVLLTAHAGQEARKIQWFRDNVLLLGQDNDSLIITQPGAYFVVSYNEWDCASDHSEYIRVRYKHILARDDQWKAGLFEVSRIPVLVNDSVGCWPMDSSSVHILNRPQQGDVTPRSNGIIEYRPHTGAKGNDQFSYLVFDLAGYASNEAFVYIVFETECAMVYPNPTDGKLNVRIYNPAIKKIRLLDGYGNTVYQTDVQSANEVLDMSAYAAGIYILQLTEGTGTGCILKVQKK